jgi:hypothetical protein
MILSVTSDEQLLNHNSHVPIVLLHIEWHTEMYLTTTMLIQILTSFSFSGTNNMVPVTHYSSFDMLIHNNNACFFVPFFPTKHTFTELNRIPNNIVH